MGSLNGVRNRVVFDLWENVQESSGKENASPETEKEGGHDHLLNNQAFW